MTRNGLAGFAFVLVLMTSLAPARVMYPRFVQAPAVTPAALPPLEFTPREVVDILADYSLIQQGDLYGGTLYGVTQPGNRRIYINSDPDLDTRRVTVIHELIHVMLLRKGVHTSGDALEAAVEAKAQSIYQWIYGVPVQELELFSIPEHLEDVNIEPVEVQ